MTKPKQLKSSPDIRAAAHPSPTNWEKCDFSIEGIDRLTCLYEFGGNAPGEHAAIWEQSTVELLRTTACKQICEVIETRPAGKEDRLPFIRMQHDDRARWLHELLRKQGPKPSLKQRIAILLDVFAGLGHLHRNGFVHRELDLLAVLVVAHGGQPVHAKLTNFASIARLGADTTKIDDAAAEFPYATGDKALYVKADLRAAGFVASQLLTWTYSGTYRRANTYDEAISAAVGRVESEFARTENAKLVDFVSNLFGRNGEISTADEAHERLSEIVVPETQSRRRSRWWVAIVPVLAVASIAAYFTFRRAPPQTAPPIDPTNLGKNVKPVKQVEKSNRDHGDVWVSENELVGWLTGLCNAETPPPKLESGRCSVDASDFVWQAANDRECVQALIMEENCKAIKDKSHPIMVVPFMGIFTTMPPRGYDSLFDQLYGLYIVQKHLNRGDPNDYIRIVIPIGNGGKQQKHADEVVQSMLDVKLPVAAFMGFADSRGGSQRAIELACQDEFLTVTPTLSATDLSTLACFVSMSPMNRTEAMVFLEYAKLRKFKTATLYKSYGPGDADSEDDLYVRSLAEGTKQVFEKDTVDVREFASQGIDSQACPNGDHLVIFGGRYTDYPLFLHELITSCQGRFDPANVVADDSASRVRISARKRELQALTTVQLQNRWSSKHKRATRDSLQEDALVHELIRRIPVATKSFELKGELAPSVAAELARCPKTLARAGVCTELGLQKKVIPRDALLSATALQLLHTAAQKTVPKVSAGQPILSAQLRASFMKELLSPEVHDEPLRDSEIAHNADYWKLMTANHEQKFAQQGGQLVPLHSPVSLVLRTAPGDDTVLCGCAHLDSVNPEPYCACVTHAAK